MNFPFTLVFKCLKPLKQVSSREKNFLSQLYPYENSVDATLNEPCIEEALSSFDLIETMNLDNLCDLVRKCVFCISDEFK